MEILNRHCPDSIESLLKEVSLLFQNRKSCYFILTLDWQLMASNMTSQMTSNHHCMSFVSCIICDFHHRAMPNSPELEEITSKIVLLQRGNQQDINVVIYNRSHKYIEPMLCYNTFDQTQLYWRTWEHVDKYVA